MGWGHLERKNNLPAPGPGKLPQHTENHPNRSSPLPLCLRQVENRNKSSEKKQRRRKGKMARIYCMSQRAALRRRKNLGRRAHAVLCICLRGDGHCGERSTWGHQVPHLPGEGGGSTRVKEPLISCLRSSPQPTASSICQKKDLLNAGPI